MFIKQLILMIILCIAILKKFVLHTQFRDSYPYLAMCVDGISDLYDGHQLASFIATRILYDLPIKDRETYAAERRTIIVDNAKTFLEAISLDEQNWLFERTKELFQQTEDLNVALNVCTGVFDYEKILLMGWYAHYPSNSKLKETIGAFYPEFLAYNHISETFAFQIRESMEYRLYCCI